MITFSIQSSLNLIGIPNEKLSYSIFRINSKKIIFSKIEGNNTWLPSLIKKLSDQILTGSLIFSELDSLAIRGLEKSNIKENDFLFFEHAIDKVNTVIILHIPLSQEITCKHFVAKIVSLLFASYSFTPKEKIKKNTSTENICIIAAQQLFQESLSWDNLTCQSLFLNLTRISSSPYEGRQAIGKISFFNKKNEFPALIRLRKTVSFSDIRGVRKLLEVGKKKYILLGTAAGIYGLGLREEDVKTRAEVIFHGDNSWQMVKDQEILFNLAYGTPKVPSPKINKANFYRYCSTLFPELSSHEIDYLFLLISGTIKQSKGTNILIDQNAEDVVKLLQNQCTAIAPILLNQAMINSLSVIDGTVIITPKGICFGFGAILDGTASKNGNPARGGRYNSAVMYCENSKSSSLIVVVSQDGTVDLVHNMKI